MPKPVKAYPIRLAGTRSYVLAVSAAAIGDPAHILRETGNPFDAEALVVVDGDARTLGYVPRGNWLRRALIEEEKGASAIVEAAEDGGITLSVTLTDDGPIGERDFVPAE